MKRKQFFYLILIFCYFFPFINTSDAYTIYRWKDSGGTVHYSDKKPDIDNEVIEIIKTKRNSTNVPREEIIIVEPVDQIDLEEQNKIAEEEIRQYWRNLALNIEQKKERTLEEIYITEKKIDILKSNIDYYLINGYKADLMILDLRYLEGSLPPLFARLELLEEEKKQLRIDARKQGIPPGYLRP